MQTKIIKVDGTSPSEIGNLLKTRERVTQLDDAPTSVTEALEEQFLELVNIKSTYCVGANMDPIIQSYNDLVEGLRDFNAKFGVEKFVQDFLIQAKKHDVAAIQDLINRYTVQDPEFLRARTFIISCFDMEQPEKHEIALDFLLEVVRVAEENKLKRAMSPRRYAVETKYNHMIQDIQMASRHEKGTGDLNDDDKHFIDRLSFHKELDGRSLENKLCKVLEISKQELQKINSAASYLLRPGNFERIEPNKCPRALRVKISQMIE